MEGNVLISVQNMILFPFAFLFCPAPPPKKNIYIYIYIIFIFNISRNRKEKIEEKQGFGNLGKKSLLTITIKIFAEKELLRSTARARKTEMEISELNVQVCRL